MSFITGRLDSSEIRKKFKATLKSFKPTSEEVDDVLQKFWRQDAYNSLISYPEYLNFLIKFLNKTKSANFTRANFIAFMIEQIINDEQLLQKLMELSLVMELLQANEVEPEKLLEIFNELKIKSPEKIIKELKIKSIFEEKTIKEKQFIGFKHHSIQEYLAAKLIFTTKNPLDSTKRLAILKQDGSMAVKPSWYNVIRFLIESEKSQNFIGWLISMGKSNPQIIEEGYCNALSGFNSSKISKKTQSQIFDLIYETYQQRAVWLPLWTRKDLAKLCQHQHLEKFKKDINKSKDEAEKFAHRGNVVDIINRLLEDNSPILTKKEKDFWKPKFVKFANDSNENGVLQRHALSALATYKDSKLITQVEKTFEHPDKLVREAFIQFCYETDPNNKLAIEYLVKGIKNGIDIYGRFGIYKISSKLGIKELLSHLAKDVNFLKRFLDRESIFNKKERKSDKVIIDHIRKNLDTNVIKLTKNVIKTAYQTNDIYHQERSYFLEELIKIIQSQDKDYVFEIISDINASDKNKGRLLFNYEDLFSQVIKLNQLNKFFKELKKIDARGLRVAQMAIYKAQHRRVMYGEKLYQKAVKLQLIESLSQQPQKYPSIGENLHREFSRLLEPQKGKYFPTVFEFFNNNQKELEPHLTKDNKQRLAKLALEGLEKINPNQFKVKINWDSEQTGRQFTISSISSYYGGILRTAQKLISKKLIEKHRQNIINFISFAFSDDQQTILEITEPIKDLELEWVNSVCLNKEKDIRYLIPSSYIYLIQFYLDKNQKLKSGLPVLKSFVEDSKLSNSDRKYALRQIEGLISKDDDKTKKFLKKLFIKYKNNSDSEKLAIIANKILINVYWDEKSIKWRFHQLKKRLISFEEPKLGIAHWVGPIEKELDSKWFARPLINLHSDKYITNFLEILNFSLEQIPLADKNNYWPYINYLWSVVISYFENLKENGSFEPLKRFEAWLEKNAKTTGLNWLKTRARGLYQIYEHHLGAVDKISTAVTTLKDISND